MMIKAAMAAIRHDESLSPAAVYEHEGLRYVKLITVWASKRRFRSEINLEGFYLTLKEARHRDRSMMFWFWGDSEPRVYENIWVAAPHSNR